MFEGVLHLRARELVGEVRCGLAERLERGPEARVRLVERVAHRALVDRLELFPRETCNCHLGLLGGWSLVLYP